MRTSSRRRPRQIERAVAGPFAGLRDSRDPTVSSDPVKAYAVENMYPLELNKPSTLVGRPGFQQAGAQLGDSNKRTGQLVCQFTKLDGTEYTVAIVGGQGIATFDWALRTWTTVVSVANLTTNSVTLSETGRIYAVTFADELVISDGVNTPFTWDGTSGSGGITKLSNAPVFYGQPVVYYAKLFAIKNAERNVIVWSEEQDATIGYETAPYSNSWQLGQTDQEALYALAGTNEVLYYLRARSVGAVSGAVTSEFATQGTKEGVSETTGTSSPAGVCTFERRVFFPDAHARPHAIVPGAGLTPMWQDIHETIRSLDVAELADAITVYDPSTGLVLMGVTETGQSIASSVLVMNPILNVPVAVWRGFTFQALGVVKNAEGTPTLMHLSSDGYAYDHGQPGGSLWSDALNAGTVAIRHTLESAHLATDDRFEKRFARVDALFRGDGNASVVSVFHETPYGTSDGIEGSIAGGGTRWDEFNWDEANWSDSSLQRHVAFGINGTGRWVRIRLQHEVAGEEFGVESMSVSYTPAGDSAEAA